MAFHQSRTSAERKVVILAENETESGLYPDQSSSLLCGKETHQCSIAAVT